MKGLKTLIKLHQRRLDELRRKMVSLQNQKNQLLQASAHLHHELENEMKLAGKQQDMAQFFGDYAKRIQRRQAEIAGEVRKLDKQMEKLAEEISEAYGEVKKFEIALENLKQRTAEEEKRKETVMMDEIAENQHRRKKEDQ